ncbi:protein Lines homolog 1 [Salminus brasiliensis]|uniref:protein Lines homolog 1 n=1 Tax=Salminus brasiliensis TaxID=930266 RepID=UPI003B836D4D
MGDPGSDLQAVFQVFQAGDVPGMSSEELAGRISVTLARSVQRLTPPALSTGSPDVDSACLCLTLIGKMIAGLASDSLQQDAKALYEDALRKLFGPAELMSELRRLLTCRDRLLSHLTAKCVSSFVIYDVCRCGDVDPVWAAACAEAFQAPAPGCTLDTCLWSLTEVIKGVLRGDCANKREILRKLLVGFEADLTSLYSKMLLQDKLEPWQTAESLTDLSVTVSTFMDLLEALSASRLRYGVCSSVQRLMFLHTSALLSLTDSSLEYFVKKRMLLLMKRTVVQRPGEDWALGERHAALQGDEFLTGDMRALADAVLQAVGNGWLRRVWVKPQPSFFGGNRERFPDDEGKDAVMLRAVSLILIRSLQVRTQHAHTEGAEHVVDVQQYLQELLAFLQERVAPFKGETHNCSWILTVFSEQDDDIMESAKTLTTLYLYQRGLSSSALQACSWGCNPHCHFILLLRSLSFDHTVLLDFLISAETCFLEYCVLYLKLLRDNWQDFCDSCCRIEDTERTSESSRRVTSIHPQPLASEASLEATPRTSSQAQTAQESRTSQRDSAACSRPRLVDYGSSEESEEEEKGSVLNLQTVGGTEELEADSESRREGVDLVERAGAGSADSLVGKVRSCLTELKAVLTKLHSRGLFPYNPTSLLKLLMAVEAKAGL